MAILGKGTVEPMAKHSMSPTTPQINMIGEGTVVEGTLKAQSDIRISGSVVGKVRVEGKVIVAKEGSINGDLIATNADVSGSVQGQIEISERLVLKSTAQVTADIKTARLVVEEGAVFDGKCEMGQISAVKSEPMKKTAPTAKPIANTGYKAAATA